MEASVEQAPTTTPNGDGPEATAADPAAETSPAERQGSGQLFQFSRFLHVGPGAEECDEGEDGSCANPLHFHAWIRLPNQFQHNSIREKALAAKARKLRRLNDPESDERAIIDADLDDLVRRDDRESMIEEVVNKDFLADHMRAMREVEVETEGEGEESPYLHIDEDRERLRALELAPEEERSEDELKELRAHVEEWQEKVNAKRQELQKPVRDAVQDEPIEKLREIVFKQRSENVAQEEFNSTYSLWEWYISTMQPQPQGMPAGKPQLPSERVFADVNHLKAAAPEIINSLDRAFTELEAEAGRAMRGF